MNRSDWQKLIDNCRSEADLQLSEIQPLAELIATDPAVQTCWEKSQQMDAEIRQVIQDVPVPSGLESRLLAALAVSVAEEDSSGRLVTTQAAVSAAETVVPRHRAWNWQAMAVGLTGIAALVLVSVMIWPRNNPQLATEEQARGQAIEWITQLDQASWKKGSTPPATFVLPSQLGVRPSRWQSVPAGSSSPQAVCYDLTSRGSGAFMFVAASQQTTSLPNIPPSTTYPKGSWHIAAWKSLTKGGELVYLLAVEHGNQYQNLIRRPSNLAKTVPLPPARAPRFASS